jgi:hypothetical protein
MSPSKDPWHGKRQRDTLVKYFVVITCIYTIELSGPSSCLDISVLVRNFTHFPTACASFMTLYLIEPSICLSLADLSTFDFDAPLFAGVAPLRTLNFHLWRSPSWSRWCLSIWSYQPQIITRIMLLAIVFTNAFCLKFNFDGGDRICGVHVTKEIREAFGDPSS